MNTKIKDERHLHGFTLAEILIVIGVIGVVAAMGIPSLINNIQDEQYKTGLKKSLSVINQAYLKVKDDNGGNIKGICATNDSTCFGNIFKPYLSSNYSVSGVPNSTNLPGCWNNSETFIPTEPKFCILTNDGMAFDFDMEWSDCNSRCGVIDVDTNGLKAPNVWGKDRYEFYVYDYKITPISGFGCNNGTGVYTNNQSCAYVYLYQ